MGDRPDDYDKQVKAKQDAQKEADQDARRERLGLGSHPEETK